MKYVHKLKTKNHMKFTKQEAIEALKAKIPTKDKELDLGRTITEAVDNSIELVGEDSEMELNDFVEKVWKQVKTSIGLTHSENSKVANKLQGQIDDLKKQIKGGKGDDDGDDDKDKDPKIKALQDELDNIKKRLQEADSQKSIAEKRTAIKNKMAESIKDKDWIEAYLSEISITADTDVEAKAKDYVAFYNKTHTKGGKITPKPAGDDDDDNSNVKSIVAAAARIKEQMYGNSQVRTETK